MSKCPGPWLIKSKVINMLWLPITLKVCNHTHTETMIVSSPPSRKGDILIAFPPSHWRKKTALRDKRASQFLKRLRSTVQSLFKTSPFKFICWNSRRVLSPPSKVSTGANLRGEKMDYFPGQGLICSRKPKHGHWNIVCAHVSSGKPSSVFNFQNQGSFSGRGLRVRPSDGNSRSSDS